MYLWHSLLSQISYCSLFNSHRTVNKRTINRCPLKVFCDRCWLCFLSVPQTPGGTWTGPDALAWQKGLWPGQVFSSLACGPSSNPVAAPHSRDCQEAFSSPSCPLPASWPWGSCPNSDPCQMPLGPMTLVCSWGEATPSSPGATDNFCRSPAPVPALIRVQVSFPALPGLPKVTPVFHNVPRACSERIPGRSEDTGAKASKF